MPEPFSAEQLNQLRQRWERDPKSRAFLQLAEEYRRAGRSGDAIVVLRAGLKEHPSYLSAQVALGRCLVETGDAVSAIEILERAVARDPTQLVANKLLVEAYLATGDAGKARERLDLYRLFNDRDAEIDRLNTRIVALERASSDAPAAARPTPRPVPEEALFDLPAFAALPAVDLESVRNRGRDRVGEPFGALVAPGAARRIDEAFAEQGIFALQAATPAERVLPALSGSSVVAAVSTLSALSAIAETEPEAGAPVDWESAAWPTGSAQPVELAAAAPLAEPAAESAAESDAGSWPEPEPEPEFAPATAPAPTPELAAAPATWWSPPVAAPAEIVAVPDAPQAPRSSAEPGTSLPAAAVAQEEAAPRAASATLGELYLAQGHLDEAEESFLSVLQSRPGDTAALAGIESVRLQRGDESAAFSEDVAAVEESNAIVGGLTARKAALLKEYLARLRRGAKRHVS